MHETAAILVVGMAGSGKTSFIQRFYSVSRKRKKNTYIVNIDPAVMTIPYPVNIDIRDTVNYKRIMEEYNLGPNGAILTATNLFATRFDQVMALCERRRSEADFIVIDTPGQIEIFTWSASGTVVTEAFSGRFKTYVFYILDIARANNPQVFISNMLQAVSILYRFRNQLIILLNKVDVSDSKLVTSWLQDFEKFQEALDEVSSSLSELSRSINLVIHEFQAQFSSFRISCLTGEGFEDLFTFLQTNDKIFNTK